MNMNSLLSDPEMNGTEFTIVRRTWTQESGVPLQIDVSEIIACGTIHPADPTRLDLLPEESRHEPIVLIHSTEPLSLGSRNDEAWTAPDEVHCGGRIYRVFQVRPWQAFGFWKAWAVQIRD